MKKNILLFGLLCFSTIVMAQNILNMTLLSNVDYQENCNDIWGYVAPDGTEYAILGTTQATAILDLSDPENPVEVAYIPGANSTWRDMKQWGEFVYVTTDVGQDGLLVVDMSGAPDTITHYFWQPEIPQSGGSITLQTCHNIYIDEKGYAYLAGCNMNGGGEIIIDVHTTPGQPIFAGAVDPVYSHDSYARGDTLYASNIYGGLFSVIDVSDKSNPVTLASQTTTSLFTHNTWLSDDGKYLFTTDERGNAYVDAYDITDLSDIKLLDSYRPADTEGTGVIPHNTHYFQGYLITSYYTDGVKIVDAHRPDNLIEVGSFDTYLPNNTGFSGAWGATPFLPSGLVLVSDINTGLWVFEPNYVRACYLEGQITDQNTGEMISGAEVIITSAHVNSTSSDATGNYKTGQATAGTFDVTVSKLGYMDKTVSANLVNGEVTILDVALEPLPTITVFGNVKDKDANIPIGEASIYLKGEVISYEITTDGAGFFTLEGVFIGEYEIYSGAWGYESILHATIDLNDVPGTALGQTIELSRGYQDDFILDLGWETSGSASTGQWERDIPIGTEFQGSPSNPGMDADGDLGDLCYMTGNGGGNAGTDDVDDGNTVLMSPPMDLTLYDDPIISYDLWFYTSGGNSESNDWLEVRLSNGVVEVIVEDLDINTSGGAWRPMAEIRVADFLPISDNIRFIVETADDDPGHLVEAALDAFSVSGTLTNTKEVALSSALQIDAMPNPSASDFAISYDLSDYQDGELLVFNMLGQVVDQKTLNQTNGTITLGASYEKGIYFVQLLTDKVRSIPMKIVKQ